MPIAHLLPQNRQTFAGEEKEMTNHADSQTALGPWLNAEQAARYLALPSVKAIYEAVRRGQIPVHRLGNRLRFNRLELDQVLLKNNSLTLNDVDLSWS